MLRDSSLADITAEFTAGTLSALPIDPTGTTEFEIHADHEIRYYNTTALQYIGFNRQSGKAILESADFRRAITYAVDRNALIDEFFDGNAVAAPFGFSPSLSFYNSELEEDTGYSLKSLSSILNSIGFADSDGDTWLEHNGEKVALKLIINSDNSRKVNLARSIADTLRSVGINITLSVLSWNEYLYAIDTGNFDLYYAESQLTADFNLKEILTYGGNINHSGVSDEKYSELIDAYLAAPDDDARKASFESLAQYIKSDSTVIPLILKKYAVLTQRGEILGLKPTYSGILTGFAGCTIK